MSQANLHWYVKYLFWGLKKRRAYDGYNAWWIEMMNKKNHKGWGSCEELYILFPCNHMDSLRREREDRWKCDSRLRMIRSKRTSLSMLFFLGKICWSAHESSHATIFWSHKNNSSGNFVNQASKFYLLVHLIRHENCSILVFRWGIELL